MSEVGVPLQYRLKLDGGDVLVVTLEYEQADEIEEADPTSIGEALLSLIGRGNKAAPGPRTLTARPAPRRKVVVRPVEPTAEEWLEQSSREALGRIASGK